MLQISFPEEVLEKLRCSSCKQYLSLPPIYSYPNGEGVRCGRCPILADKNPVRDVNFETIAKYLPFSCPYKQFGCVEHVGSEEMKYHEESCMFKQYPCPVLPLHSCTWRGFSTELLSHYWKLHKRLIMYDSMIKIHLESDNENNYLLKKLGKLFMVYFKYDSKSLVFWCAVQVVGDKSLGKQFVFQLKLMTERGTEIQKLPKTVVYDENAINFEKKIFDQLCRDGFKDLHDNVIVYFYLNFALSSTLNNAAAETNLNITQTSLTSSNEDVVGNILEELKCPVCFDYMVSPIFLCQLGHSLCQICAFKCSPCPFCKKYIMGARNYTLEHVINYIKYTCKYHKHGCLFMSLSGLASHENKCEFKSYACLLNGFKQCGWDGKLSDMLNHLKQKHKGNIIPYKEMVQLNNKTVHCHLFVFEDLICRIIFKKDRDVFYWNIQILESEDIVANYMFTLVIVNENSGEEVRIKQKCNSLTTFENAFNVKGTYVVVPVEYFMAYLGVNQQHSAYSCDIEKRLQF